MLDLRLLGGVEAWRDGAEISLGGARRRSVLAMLALDAGRVVSAGRLIEGVWGEEPPDTAATALHGHISQLRRLLGGVIETRPPGYVLAVEPACIDIDRFEALLDGARVRLAAGDPGAAIASLDEALELWRGEPLGDVAGAPFAAAALPRLAELGVAAREERIEGELARGRHAEVLADVRALVADEPLRERPRGQFMLALYRSGRNAEALDAYGSGRRLLADELGIEPGEPLRRLHEQILREDPDLGTRASLATAAPAAAGRRSRRPVMAAIALAVLALGGAAVAVSGRNDDKPTAAPVLEGGGVVRVDPGSMRAAAAIALPGTPSSIAAGAGRAWVVDADSQTITEVTAGGRDERTFASGASPVDLAASAAELWVAEGRTAAVQSLAPRVATLAHLAGPLRAVRSRLAVPSDGTTTEALTGDQIALTPRSVWVVAPDGDLVQVDRRSDERVRSIGLAARAVAGDGERAWALTTDATLISVADDGTTGVPVAVEPASALAVGAGAAWLHEPGAGTVTRVAIDDPGRRVVTRVGAGPGALAYGEGAAWFADSVRGRLLRLDPVTGAVSGELAIGGVPRDVAVSGDGVWVSASASAASALADCSGGDGEAAVTLVTELPLRRGERSPTEAMAAAVGELLERRRNRAGRFTVDHRLCDDSTAQAGGFDEAKCLTNARAYAADASVVAEIGPYNSACAARQIPVAAAAAGGALAMISPTASSPALTAAPPGGERGAFTRVLATDDAQGAAMAGELRRRRRTRVFVLDDAAEEFTIGREEADHFAAAAERGGLRVVGRASWPETADVAARVARADPDAVYVSGQLDTGAGDVIAELRAQLGPAVTLAGPELLLPVADLWRASGGAAEGMLLTTTMLPAEALPAAGRAIDERYGNSAAVYATAAAEVALDAIARSDGTRRSVAQALAGTDLATVIGRVRFDERGDLVAAPVAVYAVRRGGGSRELLSTDGAEFVRAVGPR